MRILRAIFILCLMAVSGLGQGFYYQFFTTNSAPDVAVTPGTNAFVTFSLVGQTRQYKIDVPSNAVPTQQTNWPLSFITNAWNLTNWALLSTNTFTNTIVSAGSNVYVTPSLSGQTRTYTVDVPTNAFPAQRTQWAITDITNSLNLTNWALLSTNSFTNVIVAAGSNAFVTPSLSGQVRTYTVDVPTQTSSGGSSNITDSGYIAVIRNANVQTNLNASNLTVTNPATFQNGLTNLGTLYSSNVYFQTTLTANLPTPASGNFPIMYASDVVTSRGTGDHVRWDGSNWRTVEGVIATTSIPTFMVNCLESGLNIRNKSSFISFESDQTVNGGIMALMERINGSSGGSLGSSIQTLSSGTFVPYTVASSPNRADSFGPLVPTIAANNYYGYGGSFFFSALCDGTDKYYAQIGFSDDAGFGTAQGAYFLYDMFTNSFSALPGLGISYTNNWICVCERSSAFTVADSGLVVSANSATINRLYVAVTNGACLFYTNGVLAATITANQPNSACWPITIVKKSAGSTSRSMYEAGVAFHYRHPARTYP